ncbi:hypothetical protein N7532_001121 [Penicillium argentinense]|uniref:Fungal STAND N-terminal Goodbye domain-containing protein n=1 Tax=Penicillium argentinense TaxID=1131581 RepID=A0A9W9G237_9EURO|nr:uncharacterized protein N7532_001121 [Penicillium argentinense]KAJ5110586.1 hypothetical protein N7532_001121 [Penicillium argentinense]
MRWPRRKSKVPNTPTQEPLPSTLQGNKPPPAQPPMVQSTPSSPSQGDYSKPVQTAAAQSLSPPPAPPPRSKHGPPQSVQPPTTQPIQSQPAQIAPPGGLASIVSGGAPLGSDATANKELTKIWLQVQEKVSQLAESEGKKVDKGLEIDNVLANLDASQEKEEKSPARQAVKTTFGRTMGLIKTVGGIVADGASTVFAPAGQCYNVISFLINAYDGYQGAFEGLADLLDKCSAHLGRLDYYVKAHMDAKLSGVAAQQLLLFVNICDAALKLRYSAAEKFKTGMKIAFLQENDIQGLLGQMEKLAEKERGLVSAQTFERACAAATSAEEGAAFSKRILDKITQNDANQKEKAEKEDQERALVNILAFDKGPDRWDSAKQEPVDYWQRSYNEIRKYVVPGTGKWLMEHAVFHSWRTDFASSPILAVEGTDLTGKSYLTSSVIKFLQTEMTTKGLRHLVSFYFLERDEKNGTFDAAAKSLIWQLAKADVPYRKSVSRISQTPMTLDPHEVIPKLLLENTGAEHMDAVFYLVIDGLGDILDDTLVKFLRQVSETSKRIRVFLTGTPAAFAQIKKCGVAYQSIPISGNNHDDIKKFIDARMDRFDALSDTERIGVAERRMTIREDLSKAAGGDYYKINSALNAISTLDYMEEIKEVIKGAHNDRSRQIKDQIEKLNRERTVRQIQEINHIILWITFAIEPISVEHISATLFMNVGEAPMQSLPERFRTKYLLFEVDSNGKVGFRLSKTLEDIPQRRHLKKPDTQNAQEIQAAEINMIKHFLDKVCPPEVYEKLELDKHLQRKLTHKQYQVQQEDKDTGHLLLARDCLLALSKSRDASIAELQDYAREQLVKHLASVDLSMVDRDQKSQIGELLVRVFTKHEYVDAFMWPEIDDIQSYHTPVFELLENSQYVEQVARWFKDTAAVSRVTDESDRAWIKGVVSDNAVEVLLKPSAVRLAQHCMREPLSATEVRQIYLFVGQFLSKICYEPEMEDDRVARFEKWAQEVLQLTNIDTLWHTQMAMTYETQSLPERAIERCDLALQMDSKNWRASFCRARAVPPDQAVAILTALIRRQEENLLWMQDPRHVEYLADLNFKLAELYWETGDHDLAISTFSASFQQAPRRIDRSMEVLERYAKAEKWTTISSFLESLATINDGKHIADMVLRHGSASRLHEIIRDTAMATQQFGIMDKTYHVAIKRAERRTDHKLLFLIRAFYGLVLHTQPNRREDKVIELWETSLKNDFPSSGLGGSELLAETAAKLGGIYLQRALVAKKKGDLDSVAEYLRRISDILPEEVNQSQLVLPPQLYLARFHHVSREYAKARELVRTMVQVALELLSDDDEKNDSEAFAKLLYVFIPLGDEKNVAAVSALFALGTLWNESDESGNGEGREYDIDLQCSGLCEHKWRVPSEMWICMNCIMVYLEENCLRKLREGRLEQNVCHQDHDFLEVPKWDEDRMASLPKGKVPWGNQNITLDEWVQEIRKEYLGLDA